MKGGQWHLAACPVCRGDLQDEAEELGWATCLMCGRSFAVADLTVATRQAAASEAGLARVAGSEGPSKAA